MNFNTFLYGENYPITKLDNNDIINFWIEQQNERCSCPFCGWESSTIKDSHLRKIQDTPIHNKNVYINISVREFKCKNPHCSIKTFTEELPFASKNQIRTYALNEFILTHAIYMSSNTTSLILSILGVDISADTIDNMLKKVKIKDNPDVEMIGIDDVSTRKGIKYATAIYDLETHHLIALLPGRNKEDVIPWLKEHKKIIFVARDRASAYAEAVSEVFPESIQIADRFHLFDNLLKYLKDILYSKIPNKIVIKDNKIVDTKAQKVIRELANIDEEKLNKLVYTNDKPLDEDGHIIEYIDYLYDLSDEKYKIQAENRKKKYNDIINMRNETLSLDEISKKYNYNIVSIRKYLKMTDEEVEKIKEKKKYNTKKEKFADYKNIVYKMLRDGVEYEYIIAYIKKIGYTGNITTLKGNIYKIAKNNNLADIKFSKYNKYEYKSDETIISRNELLKYLLSIKTDNQNNDIAKNIHLIYKEYSITKRVKQIFRDFHYTVFSKDSNNLDIFIELHQDIVPSFCNGLKKDIAAVKNAISDPINSGFVEGNNNKFKLIKRIVYGKQKLCNLFKRCFLAFTSTLDNLFLLKDTINSICK